MQVSFAGEFNLRNAIAVIALMLSFSLSSFSQGSPGSDWKTVEQAMGRNGQMQPGDVIKFGMPRKDLHVSVGEVVVKPGLALGSWAAFKKNGNNTMVMGDLVLLQSEVEPVMRKLQEAGIEISAVHNHLLGETPRIMYMHMASHGDAVKMAQAIHDALALTKTPGPQPSPNASPSEAVGIDQKKIEAILGRKGNVNGGILQFGIPRAETINDEGTAVPPSMGVATGINFQPTGNGKAAITGDFVLIGKEVNPVMKALGENGIEVTALHSHMLMEDPRLFFMHFWANDNAEKLAKGLRAALDLTNSKK